MTQVLVTCGEASGDLLAGGVIRAIKAADPGADVTALGGDHCREAGADVRWDVRELSVMGIAEVLPKLWRILRLMDDVVETARQTRPDVALLVDAPDFNLRLARRLRRLGIRVVTYVSPSVWAWRQGRVKTIARYVNALCCILPFEEAWLRARGVDATFVGHPLLEQQPSEEGIATLRRDLLRSSAGPLLALLPGSRRQEVDRLLPAMLSAARILSRDAPGLEVALPVAPTISREIIQGHCTAAGFNPVLVDGRAREVLGAAGAALVASGTATLEATLARTPMVVSYRVPLLTELVFRLFVRAKFIALPNLLAGEEIVPEILQRAMTPETLAARVAPLLRDTADRRRMVERLGQVRASLGQPGASARVAGIVLNRLLPPTILPLAPPPHPEP